MRIEEGGRSRLYVAGSQEGGREGSRRFEWENGAFPGFRLATPRFPVMPWDDVG